LNRYKIGIGVLLGMLGVSFAIIMYSMILTSFEHFEIQIEVAEKVNWSRKIIFLRKVDPRGIYRFYEYNLETNSCTSMCLVDEFGKDNNFFGGWRCEDVIRNNEGKLVFLYLASSVYCPDHEIRFLINGTGEEVSIYDAGRQIINAKFSRDGKKILFSMKGPTRDVEEDRVCIVDSDGKNFREITKGWDPTWTPDGKIVFVKRSGNNDIICIIDPEGKNEKAICAFPPYVNEPSVSPDGKYIVIVHNRELVIMDMKGHFKTLTKDKYSLKNPLLGKQRPLFTPDGNIVYQDTISENESDIYLLILKTGEKIKLTREGMNFSPLLFP
jgi:dipeptidyl aminopeptidase/acylaminoacyl peptidase